MKIRFDKKSITLEKLKEVKQLITDWKDTLTPDIMENYACIACCKIGKLIRTNYIEATMNHFEPTLWAECIIQTPNEFIIVSFDILQANENIAKSFIRTFKFSDSYCL